MDVSNENSITLTAAAAAATLEEDEQDEEVLLGGFRQAIRHPFQSTTCQIESYKLGKTHQISTFNFLLPLSLPLFLSLSLSLSLFLCLPLGGGRKNGRQNGRGGKRRRKWRIHYERGDGETWCVSQHTRHLVGQDTADGTRALMPSDNCHCQCQWITRADRPTTMASVGLSNRR